MDSFERMMGALEKLTKWRSVFRRFRGFKSSPVGMEMDLAVIQEHGTMDGWRP